MLNPTSLACLTLAILGAIPVLGRKEIEGENIKFFSEKDLRVFIKETSIVESVCQRKIQFTYKQGLTQDNVFVPCWDSYDEFNAGDEYTITKTLYSPDPETVFVITPKKTCVKYFNNNGAQGGPETLPDAQCAAIKSKVGLTLQNSIMKVLAYLNPSNFSGSFAAYSTVSGSLAGVKTSKVFDKSQIKV